MRRPEILIAAVLALVAPALFPAGAPGAARMTLEESIREALSRNVSVHSAAEGTRAAESRRKEAFTGFLPRFSTSYSYTHLNEPPHMTIPSLGEVTTGTRENYLWSVEMRQPLFAGGGILANYQISRLEAGISRREETATVQDTIRDVTVAYFTILKTEKIRDVALQSVEQLKSHRNVARNFFAVGLIPKNDLLTAEVQLANGAQNLLRAENDVDLAKAQLNTVMRRDVNEPVDIEDMLSYEPYSKDLSECLKTAMENRPEITALALRTEAAKTGVTLARSEYFPNLNLVGNYSKFGEGPDLAGTPFRDTENWYVMAVASWNFWEWGRTRYRVGASLSREIQSADALTGFKDRIALEVKNAYLSMREAEKRISVTRTAIGQAEENFRINQERYREHIATSTDVIDAQTLLARARADYFGAISDYRIAIARLDRAMGISSAPGVRN
ncbi:MAG TPA: TolC family protein [Syntrophales bacterium]|nr:TolC family protein [Syntrophales bacterium]